MNFQFWGVPPAQDVNAIETLGNPGWNWEEFKKYFKRVETFHPPTEGQAKRYAYNHVPEYHGTSGPIQTMIPHRSESVDNIFLILWLEWV